MELIAFYSYSFLVAAIAAPTLAFVGKHYFSRGNILEIFLLSQMALLGNLLSKLIFRPHDSEIPGLLCSYVFFAIGKLYLYKKDLPRQEQGPFMVGGYSVLLALQYLIIGFFPQLDSHMSLGFFGNMVTASFVENTVIVLACFIFAVLFVVNRQKVEKNTIEISILQAKDKSLFELMLFSLPLLASLYSLGFLFTMSFLLLPALIAGKAFSTEKKASFFMLTIAGTSSVLGLFFSIALKGLNTTSMQIGFLFGLLVLVRIWWPQKQ